MSASAIRRRPADKEVPRAGAFAEPRVPWLIATAGLLLLALLLLAPRFSIPGPSLVDDWNAVEKAARGFDALVRLEYLTGSPVGTDAGPVRYRPSYPAVWNPLQWETFGGERNLTGANVWNGLRLALLVIALSAIPLAARPARRAGAPGPLATAALCAAPVAVILTTPAVPVMVARFGPTEPLMVGGLAGGGLLLVLALRNWLQDGRAGWRRVWAPAAGGELVWMLGVYAKEPSVCVLLLLPFLYMELNRRWRERGLIDGPLVRRRPFAVVAALLLAPVLHLAVMVLGIATRGRTTYGQEVPSASEQSVWADRISEAARSQWDSMNQLLGTPLWRALALALPFLLLAGIFARRRILWLPAGLILMGWAVMLFQGLGGGVASRYFLPVIALFALAAALLLAELPVWFRAVALVVAALFVVANLPKAHDSVSNWAYDEKAGHRAVEAVAALNPERCLVYQSAIDLERRLALPTLARRRAPEDSRCNPRFEAFLVQPVGNESAIGPIGQACADPPSWQPLPVEAGFVELRGCRRLSTGRVLVDGIGRVPVETVLAYQRMKSPY